MGTLMRPLLMLLAMFTTTAVRADYKHELFGYLDYTSGTGTITSGATATDVKEGTLRGSFGYGYFMSESVEPVFDFSINNQDKTVGTYVNNWSNTEWSFGVLFNRPDGALEDKDGKRKKGSEDEGPLAASKWIPYGGFLVASRSSTQTLSENNGAEAQLVTKLMAGCRYMVFPHIAFNFWLKASYENSQSTATTTEESKGGISKLNLEMRLFSVSVFF